MAWIRTRSSRWRATSTPPANWSRRSGPTKPSCSSTRGDQHLFADSSLPSYDAEAATLVVQRSRTFLDRVG
jgi:hypothetical protein